MADGRGGYQRPRRPAPASGPGKLSRRTDGQPIRALSDASYGEQQTFHDIQQSAPMASAPSGPQAQPGPAADLSQVIPFGAPTQRSSEPVTAGAPAGPGPGMEALGLANPQVDPSVEYLRNNLPMLVLASNLPFAGPELKQMVRRLRANMPIA